MKKVQSNLTLSENLSVPSVLKRPVSTCICDRRFRFRVQRPYTFEKSILDNPPEKRHNARYN